MLEKEAMLKSIDKNYRTNNKQNLFECKKEKEKILFVTLSINYLFYGFIFWFLLKQFTHLLSKISCFTNLFKTTADIKTLTFPPSFFLILTPYILS